MQVRKQNIFNTITGTIKFLLFWFGVIFHAIIICFIPRGKYSVKYMRFFMWCLLKLVGIKIKINGKLSQKRPLLCVCNHISVFEFATMSVAFGASFFGKIDIASYPLVGWIAKKFGVIFIDRRPSHAIDALNAVQTEMARVQYPMFLFPEGTTTNGAYVKEFKSTLFNIVENTPVNIQPIVMKYKMPDGSKISDYDMANHFAYFDNNKMDFGPKCEHPRSAFGQVFHIAVIGGFLVELDVLPVQSFNGMDRKEIAQHLHKLISDKYMESR